jgi:hypothetical protein
VSARKDSAPEAPPPPDRAPGEIDQRLDLVLWSTGDELWEVDLARDEYTLRNPLKGFDFADKVQVR